MANLADTCAGLRRSATHPSSAGDDYDDATSFLRRVENVERQLQQSEGRQKERGRKVIFRESPGKGITAVQKGNAVLLYCPPNTVIQLSDLQQHMSRFACSRATKVIIDLQGSVLCGGCLRCSVTFSPLAIKKGSLDLGEINSISNLVLEEVQVDRREHPLRIVNSMVHFIACDILSSAPVIVQGGSEVNMGGCEIKNSLLDGIIVSGLGTRFYAQSCTFSRCRRLGLLFARGGRGLLKDCDIVDSRECDGIRVKDPGSLVEASMCNFHQNYAAGVLACNQGRIDLVKCRLAESKKLSGAEVHDKGTSASFTNCEFTGNHESGLIVHSHGWATLSSCTMELSLTRCGLEVVGKGSKAEALGCTFTDNNICGVRGVGASMVSLQDCRIEGSERGFEMMDRGSVGSIVGCVIEARAGAGASIADKGLVLLRDCKLLGWHDFKPITMSSASQTKRESTKKNRNQDLEVLGKGTEVWLTRVKALHGEKLTIHTDPHARVIS